MPEDTPPNGKHDVWTHRLLAGGLVLTTITTTCVAGIIHYIGQEVPATLHTVAIITATTLAGVIQRIFQGNNQ